MKYIITILSLFCLFSLRIVSQNTNHGKESVSEKTVFQTSGQWKPVTDVRADVAIVYGANDRKDLTFEERVNTWREKGYTTHFMTGIAWGEYQDYFTGKWDGEWHLDEGQKTQQGDTIWHGHMVPYIIPTKNFIKYLKEEHIKKVIDAGIDAIYLEEPEFWARAGYSEAFKNEWKEYYGFEWRPQHESPENTYLSNKLKYHLYYEALNECFTYAKEYGKSKGMDVRCYVPTHSLVNYSQWQIVSPEASLASLPSVDGYIAQVWTGTSREPNYYNGQDKERVFETAFLEYGSMESMTAPTGRKMFFLTDPIEDRSRDWKDYKKNYEATFTAQLLYPNIANYEVMPWPDRIYEDLYRTSKDSEVRERIPRFYSTQMQVMINSLNFMPVSENMVSGSHGISVLMSNSLMFQRFPTHEGYEDPQLSNFYGQALPFVKRGIPVKTLHLENVSYPNTWKDTKILLMTYSNMKPLSEESHSFISEWVKSGGILVYSGRDTDPFQSVSEWWNKGNNSYERASDHLFKMLGLNVFPNEGMYQYGKGLVYILRKDPKEFVLEKDKDNEIVNIVKDLYEKDGQKLIFKNNYTLSRGPYEIISVLEESTSEKPLVIEGVFIDLFDPQLPVITEKIVQPGEQAFLFNINKVDSNKPQVLAAASRVYDEKIEANSYSFLSKSPLNTNNVMRISLPASPKRCNITNTAGENISISSWEWDDISKTCKITFENNPEGTKVEIEW